MLLKLFQHSRDQFFIQSKNNGNDLRPYNILSIHQKRLCKSLKVPNKSEKVWKCQIFWTKSWNIFQNPLTLFWEVFKIKIIQYSVHSSQVKIKDFENLLRNRGILTLSSLTKLQFSPSNVIIIYDCGVPHHCDIFLIPIKNIMTK